MIKSHGNWDRGARVRQAHEGPGYLPGETLASDYERFRRRKAPEPRRSLVSGDAKALIFGALAALVFLAIVIW